MNLIFYDRSAPVAVPSGDPVLTIERGGNFAFTVALVEALKLAPESQALLAQDADTNTWYLLFGQQSGRETFTLRSRDRKGKALQFCSQPNARAYFRAHGLNRATTRSVRAGVGLEPVQHERLLLYPLVPRHETTAVAPATASPAPVAEAPAPEPAVEATPAPAELVAPPVAASPQASKYTAEQDAALLDMSNSPSDLARAWNMSAAALHTRRSYLKKKHGEAPVPAVVAPASAPAVPTLIYTPATSEGAEKVTKTLGLQARAQELTSYWLEREISRTTPSELAEILNLMRHIPSGTRGVEMQLVLDRAEAEQSHRQLAAGKGAARG